MNAPVRSLSRMSAGIVGSEILKIAAEIRAKIAQGENVLNLTVGDFRPDLFPIPESLRRGVVAALEAGETNYPPSDGLLDLRKAVQRFYAERLGLEYPISGIIIASGVRPTLYTAFRTLLDEGDTLLYPVPSWNNNHYTWLSGAKGVAVEAGPETHFLPTAESLRPHIGEARVLTLNSPLNPAGTAYSEPELEKIVALVLDENGRRDSAGRPPLMLVYDQVYWMLTFGLVRHLTPVGIDPRMRPYTVFNDGISKSFAATGLRVGWCVGPDEVMGPFSSLLGHIGAWAPRAEQAATVSFLQDAETVDRFLAGMKGEIVGRLELLHEGFGQLKQDGYPVDSIPPQSTIYLSVRFDLIGKSLNGNTINTNEEIRRFLLEQAGFAAVPFQAFGLKAESGWFRLSVGAVSQADIRTLVPALRRALDAIG